MRKYDKEEKKMTMKKASKASFVLTMVQLIA
jgi:hypothetical protein